VPKCILIVDDSPLIRKTLRETLERHEGWQVCGEAANGREGIEKAQQLKSRPLASKQRPYLRASAQSCRNLNQSKRW
jgi:CheY-like chemotaxis protein